ncbi:MAG: alpha/beta fold hydrolase [Flavobacteriaceae bacterium]|nr:alpha/beta fold hydrolase [Flavobacteriaceae bacterium]
MKLHSKKNGQGTPLFILHGFLGMGDNWKTLGKEFAELGFEVHLIDQRNHGRSPHTEEFSYDLMADDIKEYMEQHQIQKASLLGHSMGGKNVMLFATKYPDLVNQLIVVDIAPKYYEPHHQTILEGLTKLSETQLDSRGKADELLKEYISEWGVRQFLLKNLYWKEKNKLGFRMNLEGLKANIDQIGLALPEKAQYANPVLFIDGEKSNYINGTEDKDLIRKHFPKAQIITIKGAGHWVHAEKKEEFYKTVKHFLHNE